MEWVETTGRTVDEAKEAALDQLGVDERDAEFDVLEEPRTGLFGRTRGEARVRARVRPMAPRPKVERRDRRRRRGEGSGSSSSSSSGGGGRSSDRQRSNGGDQGTKEQVGAGAGGSENEGGSDGSGTKRRRSRSRGSRSKNPATANESRPGSTEEGSDMSNDVTVEEQATIMRTFLDGLVDAFDLDASIADEKVDEETI